MVGGGWRWLVVVAVVAGGGGDGQLYQLWVARVGTLVCASSNWPGLLTWVFHSNALWRQRSADASRELQDDGAVAD